MPQRDSALISLLILGPILVALFLVLTVPVVASLPPIPVLVGAAGLGVLGTYLARTLVRGHLSRESRVARFDVVTRVGIVCLVVAILLVFERLFIRFLG